jgi:hypothetical protein
MGRRQQMRNKVVNEDNTFFRKTLKGAKEILDFSFKILAEIYSFLFSGLFLLFCLCVGFAPIAAVVWFIVWLVR